MHFIQIDTMQSELIKCPYNPKHLIPINSFQKHLKKCKSQNKKQFTRCKYHPNHIIRKNLIQKHYEECLQAKMYQQNNQYQYDDQWSQLIQCIQIQGCPKSKDGKMKQKQQSAIIGEDAAPSQIAYQFNSKKIKSKNSYEQFVAPEDPCDLKMKSFELYKQKKYEFLYLYEHGQMPPSNDNKKKQQDVQQAAQNGEVQEW